MGMMSKDFQDWLAVYRINELAEITAQRDALLEACRAVALLPTNPETGSMAMTGRVYRMIVQAIARAEGREE